MAKNNKSYGYNFDSIDEMKQRHTEMIGMEDVTQKVLLAKAKQYAKDKSKTEADIEKETALIVKRIWATQQANKTAGEKAEALKQKQNSIKTTQEQVQEQINILKGMQAADKENANSYAQDIKEKETLLKNLAKQEEGLNKKIAKQEKEASKQSQQEQLSQIKLLSKSKSKANREAAKQQLKELNAQNKQEYDKKLANEKKLTAELKEMEDSGQYTEEELEAKRSEVQAAAQETRDVGAAMNVTSMKTALSELGDKITSGISAAMQAAEGIVTTSQSVINARLQGTDKTFQDMMDTVTDNLSISPLAEMEKVIENIREASDKGIAYNIEQRAFLDTVAEKIADTFDAFDSNLMRLIRLQQADTTAARLGMEASLTKFFNGMFNDNSYLNDVADSISAAVLNASSQMEKNAATEFEYVLQKWLGSLYSLGFSGDTLTQIATGINYLATGDVTQLSNNSSLQTLLAMSASNAGLDFAEIMLDGLDAETTNTLLESMVEYLQEIANNSDNQVIKAAYTDIFGMSVSDLAAIQNLTQSDISTISGQMLSYNNMLTETTSQLAQIISRSALSENISNLWKNVTFGMGMDMASNPATWAMNKILDFMGENKIDMNIPYISVFGSGVDLNTSVVGLLETAYGFSKAMSLIGNILGGLGSSGGLDLSAWGGTEYNQRGNAIGGLLGTLVGGTSSSVYVNNNSSDDIVNESLSSATDEAEETKKITNKNIEENDHTLDDLWKATVGSSASDYFKVSDVALLYVVDTNSRALRTVDVGIQTALTDGGSALRVVDTGLTNLFTNNIVKTQVVNDSLYVKISNANDLATQLKSAMPTQMSISSNSSINLNESTLVSAIIKALGGSGSTDTLKLKQFLDGTSTVKPTVKVTPDEVNSNFNVYIKGTDSTVRFNMQ